MNTEYLELFFRNLLLGEHNELKNRYTHVRYNQAIKAYDEKDNVTSHKSHSKITGDLTQVQQKILEAIMQNKYISQTELASQLSIARETVNRNMKKLQEQSIIRRIGADKNGHWEIL